MVAAGAVGGGGAGVAFCGAGGGEGGAASAAGGVVTDWPWGAGASWPNTIADDAQRRIPRVNANTVPCLVIKILSVGEHYQIDTRGPEVWTLPGSTPVLKYSHPRVGNERRCFRRGYARIVRRGCGIVK